MAALFAWVRAWDARAVANAAAVAAQIERREALEGVAR